MRCLQKRAKLRSTGREFFKQLSAPTSKRGLQGAGAFLATIIAAGSPLDATAQGISVDDLIVVDCLLPGQVRQLGTRTTYITPRRPVKTSAKSCAIRGGEYVSYDRADYKSALNAWITEAESGDAKAQTYVAEIYERGLGTAPNYAEAAKWYARAAEQGYSPAQLSLGRLYEQGLGVEKNLLTALNLYRQANGLAQDEVGFVSEMQDAARSGSIEELEALRKQVGKLEKKNQELRSKLDKTSEDADKSTDLLNQLRTDIADKQRLIDQARETQDLNAIIDDLNSRITEQQTRLEQQAKQNQLEREQLAGQIALQQEELATAEQRDDSEAVVSELKQQIAVQQMQLEEDAKSFERKLANLRAEIVNQQKQAKILSSKDSSKAVISSLKRQIKKQTKMLQKEARRNKGLTEQVSRQEKALASNESKRQLALAEGPSIVLKSPPVTAGTRGSQEVKVQPGQQIYLAGAVVAPAGVKTFTINGDAATLDVNNLFMFEMGAPDIANTVELKVVDTTDRVSTQRLVLKPAATANATAQPSGKKLPKFKWGNFHALVIGNNDYGTGGWASLNNAVNDAKAVDKLLGEKYGFKTTLLLNATRTDILLAVEALRNSLTEEDNLLIYYAGHGQRDDANNRAYWIPVDATTNNSANWIPSYQITDHVNAMNARHVLLVVDSCYAGLMTRASGVNVMRSGLTEEQKQEKIKDRLSRRTRMLITAGDNTEVLDSGRQGNHSVFAEAFIAALQNNRSVVASEGVFRIVQPYVSKLTYRINKQSVVYAPIPRARHEGGEFYFIPQG